MNVFIVHIFVNKNISENQFNFCYQLCPMITISMCHLRYIASIMNFDWTRGAKFTLFRLLQDLNQNRSISEALAYEDQFFHDHPVLFTSSNIALDLILTKF